MKRTHFHQCFDHHFGFVSLVEPILLLGFLPLRLELARVVGVDLALRVAYRGVDEVLLYSMESNHTHRYRSASTFPNIHGRSTVRSTRDEAMYRAR
jgi:hypothetical protein